MSETPQEAYDRGVDAGRIEARLDEFAAHFRVINGSVADTARELHILGMRVQRLADQADADERIRISTAEAVEKDRQTTAGAVESERRADHSETVWTIPRVALAVLGGLGTVVAIIVGVKAS